MWDQHAKTHSFVRSSEVPIFAAPIDRAMAELQNLPFELDAELWSSEGDVHRHVLDSHDGNELSSWCRVLGKGLRSVQFHSTLSGELLICLVYHDERLRNLKRSERLPGADDEDACWLDAAHSLREHLVCADVASRVDVIGRWKRRRLCQERDYVTETVNLASGRALVYRQPEGQFSNPNAACEVHCLNWLYDEAAAARQQCSVSGAHVKLLELHCGAGTNTVALAPLFHQVIAVEINRTLAEACEENLRANDVRNVQLVRAAAACATSDGLLEVAGAAQVLLVDPPRAGLDEITRRSVANFEHVLYISCNPDALAEDLSRLPSHDVVSLAIFDMFPYTTHSECAARLCRRAGHA